jgi:SAM-dependent methyltransferase
MTREYFKYYNKCKNILDIGPGIGLFMSCAPKKITGIDVNPKAVVFLRKQGFKCVLGDGKKLPFPDESFDGIMCSHVIEHLQPHEALELMKEISRVLKHGGLCIIRTPHFRNPEQFYHHFGHTRPYFPNSIRMLIEQYDDNIGTEQIFNSDLYVERLLYDFKIHGIMYRLWGRVVNKEPAQYLKKTKRKNEEYCESTMTRCIFTVLHTLAHSKLFRDGHSVFIRKK